MAKTSLTVSGLGNNPGKIMFYMGMLFVVLGVPAGTIAWWRGWLRACPVTVRT